MPKRASNLDFKRILGKADEMGVLEVMKWIL